MGVAAGVAAGVGGGGVGVATGAMVGAVVGVGAGVEVGSPPPQARVTKRTEASNTAINPLTGFFALVIMNFPPFDPVSRFRFRAIPWSIPHGLLLFQMIARTRCGVIARRGDCFLENTNDPAIGLST